MNGIATFGGESWLVYGPFAAHNSTPFPAQRVRKNAECNVRIGIFTGGYLIDLRARRSDECGAVADRPHRVRLKILDSFQCVSGITLESLEKTAFPFA